MPTPLSRFTMTAAQYMRCHIQRSFGSSGNVVSSQHLRRMCTLAATNPQDPRADLGRKFAARFPDADNKISLGVFKAMNFLMWAEGQPVAPEHKAVLEQKLLNENAGLFETLKAENPYVMQSSGSTPVYLLGKYIVHKPLSYLIRYGGDR